MQEKFSEGTLNTHKIAMVRSQIEAIMDVLIKNKITTHEELWELTHKHYNENKIQEV